MNFHPYKEGYNTLPKLLKLSTPIFFYKINEEILKLKLESVKNQTVFAEKDMTEEIYEAICNFIVSQVPDLKPPYTFENLAMQLVEDLVIHRIKDGKNWTSAAHVCFPAGWYPEKVVGQSFFETHCEIPMNVANGDKLMKAAIVSGPFERFVWSVSTEKLWNRHPTVERKKFDPKNPSVYVIVERQIIYGFPKLECFLFALQQYFIAEDEIDKQALITALNNMTPEQMKYKSINKEYIDMLKTHWSL